MTNLNDIVAEAVQAVGADDWRVQAGAVALLVISGVLGAKRQKVLDVIKKWRAK